jgi:hypothetical protein
VVPAAGLVRTSLVIAAAVAGVAALISSRLRHQRDVSIAIEGVAL